MVDISLAKLGLPAPQNQQSISSLGNDDLGLEALAQLLNGGRDRGQRTFYNDTRAGLWNSATAPEHGAAYGGAGLDLATRRALQMSDAQQISDIFFKGRR